jgi:hypothetical protein
MPGRRVRGDGTALRFATVEVDQSGCRSRRETNLRAVFERVTALAGWSDHARSDELIELASPALPVGGWGNKLGNNPSMGSDYHTLPRFDSPNVPAEVVLQFAYASLHV